MCHANYVKNIERHRKNNKKYREDNKEEILEYLKYWRKENKEKISKYRLENKERIRETSRIWVIKKSKVDLIFRIKMILRKRICYIIHNEGFVKKYKTEKILGCSFQEFKIFVESKFEVWMTWDNYGKYNGEFNHGWDIDHIIPLKLAESEEMVLKLNNYTNLQPLCSKINRDIKRDKLIW